MNGNTLARLVFAAALMLGSTAGAVARAATVTVDFDSAARVTLSTADYLEDGFLMQSLSGHYDILSPGLNAFTTPYLSLDIRPLTGETISAVRFSFTGGLFDLRALDVSSGTSPGFGRQEITSSAGGRRFLDFAGTERFSGTAWSDLSWIVLSGSVPILGPGFDNLVFATVVPVPPGLLLFGSGLAALSGAAGLRRRVRRDDPAGR